MSDQRTTATRLHTYSVGDGGVKVLGVIVDERHEVSEERADLLEAQSNVARCREILSTHRETERNHSGVLPGSSQQNMSVAVDILLITRSRFCLHSCTTDYGSTQT